MSNLKAGDVVILKSRGPKMTVSVVDENRAWCKWFDNHEIKEAEFSIASLTLGQVTINE